MPANNKCLVRQEHRKALKLVKRRQISQLSKKSNYCSKLDGRWDALDSAWARGRGVKWTTVLIKKELKAPPVSTYCAPASETALTGMFSHNGRLKQLSITEPQQHPTPRPFSYCTARKSSHSSARRAALLPRDSDGWTGTIPVFPLVAKGKAVSSAHVEWRCLHLVLIHARRQAEGHFAENILICLWTAYLHEALTKDRLKKSKCLHFFVSIHVRGCGSAATVGGS